MEAVTRSPAADAVLRDARLFNSDLGRHSVHSTFSARLTGRFYQNGSLERHTLRNGRLVEMAAKKRRLERDLLLEERRVGLLEERLGDTERARDAAHEVIGILERGLIRFQARVRRRQALRRFRALRHEYLMKKVIARFSQRRFRGWQGRLRAAARREELRRKRREASAATIQASVRRHSQQTLYFDLLIQREHVRHQFAATIQAMLRGKTTRQFYMEEVRRRQEAARRIQRAWRGAAARVRVEKMRQELERQRREAVRPKRIPLHLRRYSTYGSNTGGPKPNSGGKGRRDIRLRRRSSDAMIIMNDGQLSSLARLQSLQCSSSTGGEPDENDSLGTARTSLTQRTNATDASRSKSFSLRHREASWAPPPRSSITRADEARLRRTAGTSRRPSLERRQTISGSSFQKWARGRGQRPPSLETCADSDSKEGSTSETCHDSESKEGSTTPPRERKESAGKSTKEGTGTSEMASPSRRQNKDRFDNGESATSGTLEAPAPRPVSPAPEQKTATAIIVSEEASRLVRELFGKMVLSQSIVHSGFDVDFSEHEDDLE